MVPIIDDPEKGFIQNNIIVHDGDGSACKHLTGNKAGEYKCKIHEYDFYRKTPCFDYGQIESSPDTECRMGRYIIDKHNKSIMT